MRAPPTTPRHAVCIVIYSVLCIFCVSQNKAKNATWYPPSLIFSLLYYMLLQNTRKRIPQQSQKNKKNSLIGDLGEGPLEKKNKKNHLMGDPPILIVVSVLLFLVLFLCVFCFLFLDILLS